MLENVWFWLGLVGFISGILVGLSLVEDDSNSFLRNIMLTLGIMIVMFTYILELGAEYPLQMVLTAISALIGSLAVLIVVCVVKGNTRAALVAGALAGITTYLTSSLLPYGHFGYRLHDWPTLINYSATMLVGGSTYYLLRKWGREDDTWD